MKRILTSSLTALLLCCCTPRTGGVDGNIDALPEIFPDYVDVTVPENIAPLNFSLKEDARASVLVLRSGDVEVMVKGPDFDIPIKKWRLLTASGDITATVRVLRDGRWLEFSQFCIHVSRDRIDPYVAYRLIPPGYETWYRLGIYQRCLENFDQTPIITNDRTDENCMNCHSFCGRNPDKMMLHMRAANGGTYTWADGRMEKLNTKTAETISALVYPYWHPSGRFIAFSVNDIAQFFHTRNPNRIEVYDSISDVVVYDVEKHCIFTSPLLSDSTRMETFPCFSADGRKLYFCSSKVCDVPVHYKDIRYSICSIDFDPDSMGFGSTVDTVYSAAAHGKGATLPRVSPDGKFLLFSQTEYGCFAIWHHDADLRAISLADGAILPLDAANSSDAESYHSWSSNGRWIIFASRRLDGLYSRLFITHVDEDGNASKAFLLPQKKAEHNTLLLRSYNVPEFISGKVSLDAGKLAAFAKSDPGVNVSFSASPSQIADPLHP